MFKGSSQFSFPLIKTLKKDEIKYGIQNLQNEEQIKENEDHTKENEYRTKQNNEQIKQNEFVNNKMKDEEQRDEIRGIKEDKKQEETEIQTIEDVSNVNSSIRNGKNNEPALNKEYKTEEE